VVQSFTSMTAEKPRLQGTALVLVDIQNDFLPPSGSLAVAHGDTILPTVQSLLRDFEWDLVVSSLDWHPPGHVSFASAHRKAVGTSISVPVPHETTQNNQELWPDHCVQGTQGSALETGVKAKLAILEKNNVKVETVYKGTRVDVDSYSAFADNGYANFTGLPKVLYQNNIERVVVVGLALDFCVGWTAKDARKFGFKTIVISDGTRAVFPDNAGDILDDLKGRGAEIMTLSEFKQCASS